MESLTDETALMVVTSSQSEPETTTVELCTNGDFTLVVGHKHFVEGNVVQNGGLPEIVLHDDDPEAMDILLSILHHRGQEDYHQLQPHMILKVADHCDKYACEQPFMPWITQWLQKIPTHGSVRDYDCLLTAAYVFGAEQHLKAISVAAVQNLPLNFGFESPGTLRLPDLMREKIMIQMKHIAELIRNQIELAHDTLRHTTSFYIMTNEPEVCLECDRIMPYGAMKCHPCRNSNLQRRLCTNRTRSSDYLDFLASVNLWPTAIAFSGWSVADIAKKLNEANFKSLPRCSGGKECPLRVVLKDLIAEIQKIVNEEIAGL
ncbi:hypothetical protein MHUMG1_10343 [Metarhizium humberi]|uniref:BTB/POZ fold protein n=1 Tax=Metarhizium humberi TaxID=2596975 RepID=A0A9P8M150_9HYPO|nr:hypothetical protein MHUMG1_10343 [Metarhizium humberi]